MKQTEDFRAFARSVGVELPSRIKTDGKIHRFDVKGDTPGKRNGAYAFNAPTKGPAHGWVMSWKLHSEPCHWRGDRPEGEYTDEELRAWREEAQALSRQNEANRERKWELARKRAAKLWPKYKPASPSHPYLDRKGVTPHDLRQVDDSLAIPVYGPPGRTLRGFQFIWPDGSRKFLTGTQAGGGYTTLGDLRGTVILCEGWATGATLHQATGHGVIVAFSAGNLKRVAIEARKALGPNIRFLIAADNDKAGAEAARPTADAVGARIAVPQFARGESGTDFNDLAAVRDEAAVASVIESALRGAWPPEFLTLEERLARPRRPTSWRIEGWMPSHSRVLLSAQFKSGKTTARDNLCRSLLDGDPFLGSATVRPVEGTVAILDTEMSDRMGDEWMRDQGIRNAGRLHVEYLRGQLGLFDIFNEKRRSEWAGLLRDRKVEFLILDCLRPVLDYYNLSEHTDVGKFFVALDALLVEAGITDALVIHHMGHVAERSRGDSRLRDWPEVEWRLVRQTEDPSSSRFISAYGRDVDQPEQQLAFDPETRHLRLVGGSRKEAVDAGALDEVLALLEWLDEPISGRGAEDALEGDVPRDQVRKALKLGIKRGDILTEKGPRNATLHRLNPERAGARGQRAPRAECERAAPLGSRALAHSEADPGFSERAAEVPRAPMEAVEEVFGEYIES